MEIQYMRLSEVERFPRNPKDHDIGGLHTSMERFGFVAPLLIDEGTGLLVAGHGRLDTLGQMYAANPLAPPKRVPLGEDGEWLVPVVRGIAFEDEDEAAAYLVADNRWVELGGWKEDELAELLEDLFTRTGDLAGVGFTVEEVDAMLVRTGGAEVLNPVTRDPDETAVESLPRLRYGTKDLPITKQEAAVFEAQLDRWIAERGTVYGFMSSILNQGMQHVS